MPHTLAPSPQDETASPPASGDAGMPPFSSTGPVAGPAETHDFRFTGAGMEYFRIWIVNLLLSLVTLGIYSAWAKVRKKRYFYGNTWVADSNFEFHGRPLSILKGRIIAVLALGAYSAASYLSPKLGQVLFVLLVAVSPWFIARTFAFNAHYSSYRQLRFRNVATTREVYAAVWPFFIVAIAALVLSPELEPGQVALSTAEWIGLMLPSLLALFAYPYVFGAIKCVHVNRSFYGGAPFALDAGIGRFYALYVKAYIIGLIAIVCFGFFAMIVVMIPVIGFALMFGAYLVAGAAIFGYLRSRVGNLVFNATTLEGGVSFRSTLSATLLARLYFTNLLGIMLSLGLLIPWAAVRVARYRASQLALVSTGPLDAYLAARGREVAATGEELGDFFDVDLSL
ncbi:MAG: DUF898 domain-containing protein [Betaproteobacteria bacterium]|nr:DUF898 domain-containing protein [Betaproteobacteria bacterium]